MKSALIIADVQNDFYPGGALGVPKADQINEVINSLMKRDEFDKIVATQDWHPVGHESFASTHYKEPFSPYSAPGIGPVLWPDHCVQNSKGAEFHSDINTEKFDLIVRKGYSKKIDSYSVFKENDGTELGLSGYFEALDINKLYVVGLALDYCVKFTAEDAIKKGFETTIIKSGSRAIEQDKDKLNDILKRMKDKNIKIIENI
ncbi:MAG: bifunctional nicotinamidase/pyrazinamidase [Halanaerobiales bacterium]|nr:bifunctional nicotinamidase/pyrazinamidase [Halanaerobiales bacterium]